MLIAGSNNVNSKETDESSGPVLVRLLQGDVQKLNLDEAIVAMQQ